MMHNVKLVEAARGIGELRKARTVEEDNSIVMNNIITSRHIFIIVGIAT